MNVLEALIGVIPVQHASTLMGVTPVLATLDTQALAVLAHVSAATYNRCIVSHLIYCSTKNEHCNQNCHMSDGNNCSAYH